MKDWASAYRTRVPLAEVSGLASSPRGDGARVVAIGDARVSLAVADVDASGAVGAWTVLTTDDVPARDDARTRWQQLEAAAYDGSGVVWVLTEETSWLGGVDVEHRSVVGSARLDAATIPELDATWSAPGSSRGEGLLLMRDGHVLVAKEKEPAGLVEFGPRGALPSGISPDTLLGGDESFTLAGEVLDALAWWPLDVAVAEQFADLSDLARDLDGAVWLLSDQSRRLGRLELPLAPGGAVAVARVTDLPGKVRKPEGLAFLPGGVVAVAEDRHDDRDNLWLLVR